MEVGKRGGWGAGLLQRGMVKSLIFSIINNNLLKIHKAKSQNDTNVMITPSQRKQLCFCNGRI